MCLYISKPNVEEDVNVYIADKYNYVFINNMGLYSMMTSSWLQVTTGGTNISLPKINMYLYNKFLVNLGYDIYTNREYVKSQVDLHVPSLLLEEYNSAYYGDTKISSISGDIT